MELSWFGATHGAICAHGKLQGHTFIHVLLAASKRQGGWEVFVMGMGLALLGWDEGRIGESRDSDALRR